MDRFARAVAPVQTLLLKHPIYSAITSRKRCQVFMANHVFCVWDFMTLLKSLQRSLTTVRLPWLPPKNAEASYLINCIVLGEESDDLGTGDASKALSHYALYLQAMKEVGADARPIEALVSAVQSSGHTHQHWSHALERTSKTYGQVTKSAYDFTRFTLQTAESGAVHEVAAAFFYGREDPVPQMFSSILDRLRQEKLHLPLFQLYLQRHIDVDSGSHGPLSRRMLAMLCDDEEKLEKSVAAAQSAIKKRIELWDGVYDAIRQLD